MSNPLVNIAMNGAGSMFGNVGQMLSKFNEFKRGIAGKNPQQMLNELMNSGKYTQDQLAQAQNLAKMYGGILK